VLLIAPLSAQAEPLARLLDIQGAIGPAVAEDVENFFDATSQLAQTTLRSVLGQHELDEMLAERERRAKIIHAEGEMQTAEKLVEAAGLLAKQPQAIQLRYLQTLTEAAGDKSSTLVFPLPMDLIKPLLKKDHAGDSE